MSAPDEIVTTLGELRNLLAGLRSLELGRISMADSTKVRLTAEWDAAARRFALAADLFPRGRRPARVGAA